MRCKNHPEVEAVGICKDCGAALCGACNASAEGMLCAGCLVSHNRKVMREFGIEVAMSVGLFVVALSFMAGSGIETTKLLIICLMAAFLPFGWGALSRYFSSGSEYIHPVTRLMSLSFHLVVSAFLGIFVGPPRIYRAIREITKARAANATVKS